MSIIKWSLDPFHSEVTFKAKHLMISTVTGQFKKFTLEAETGTDDFSTSQKIEFTAYIDSIDTNNEQRDAHLKSADFFNKDKHPMLVFSGTKYEADEEKGKLYGNLTIGGITRFISLDVEFGGIIVDPYGQTKAGFTVTGKVSRKDFGLSWNAVTEAGNIVVSDEIKVNAEIQLVKQVKEEVEERLMAVNE